SKRDWSSDVCSSDLGTTFTFYLNNVEMVAIHHIYFSNYITPLSNTVAQLSIFPMPHTFWQHISKCSNCFYLWILLQYLQNINKVLYFSLSFNFVKHLML